MLKNILSPDFLNAILRASTPIPVSYTHLDVYKRQQQSW